MSIVFKRKTEEKICEHDGRVIAECRVTLTLPFFEDEETAADGTDCENTRRKQNKPLPMQSIRRTLLSFFDAAVAGSDGFFSRVTEKYAAERSEGHFYAYRMSVDISPASDTVLLRERCFPKNAKKGKARAKKRRMRSCSGECLAYAVTCYVSRRARCISRERKNIAFRLADGYICTLTD